MKKNTTLQSASDSRFQVIIDDQFTKTVNDTVRVVLRKNAGSWISDEDIKDIASNARMDIWMKRSEYDPAKGAFKTWTVTLAHNFAISESKKLKRAHDKSVSLTSLSGFDDIDDGEDGRSPRTRTISYRNDSTFLAEGQTLGLDPGETEADHAMMKEYDEQASLRRLALLEEFLETRLNDREKLMLEMLKDGLSKEQMMEIMHMTGGNVDTFKSRLRSKIRNFMIDCDYYGIEE